MARIFAVLALLAVLLLGANFVVGLTAGDFNAAARTKREAQNRFMELARQHRASRLADAAADSPELSEARAALAAADAQFRQPRARMTLHMMLGSIAALMTVLVSSITITYFVGTSRWSKEVCETYGIDPALAEASTRLKRSAFPWALAGIFAAIGIVGLGAAADPSGANWRLADRFVMLHYAAAMIGIVVIMGAFWMQISRIAENYAAIERIMAEVQRIRTARNLPVEESTAR